MKALPERVIPKAIGAFGYTISRKRPAPPPREPPRLFDDPLEALHHHRGGKPAAFHCPLESTRHRFGFDYSSSGWEPFVAALQEYEAGLASQYPGSVLEAFYRAWQPATAAETIAGFTAHAPPAFHRLPSHAAYVAPWRAESVAQAWEALQEWYRRVYSRFGADFDPAVHGDKFYGPVHPELGALEYDRLTSVFASIRASGYDRWQGDVRVIVLKRGSDMLFLKWGKGMHRTSAAVALGLPATFFKSQETYFDVADVDYWPGVRSGLWSREAAVDHVDHLFEFDSRRWAADRGLLPEQRHPAGPTAAPAADRQPSLRPGMS